MSKFAVLLLAAGRSTRFGDEGPKKPFATLAGRAVWLHSAERFADREDVAQTIVVVAPEDREDFQRQFGANLAFLGVELCAGGAERSDSVRCGLNVVRDGATHVAVHDAARPLVSNEEIDAVFAAAVQSKAAILGTPVTATLKRVEEGFITRTESREGLWAAQTPQAFELDLLRRAHEQQRETPVTDDAQLVEQLGQRVAVVEGSSRNLKITTPADLDLAAALLGPRSKPQKAGRGDLLEDDDFWS